ncbi:MAG: hypothetical protein P8I38_03500 [Arenicella sp.]|jgi:hypothetical protein|nr:hypothetical protein [Arenicella sp.]
MSALNTQQIEEFIHGQIACWNKGDRDGFFACYNKAAPGGLHIEYVGKHSGDGLPILEGMWEQNQEKIDIEEVALIHNGNEVACHNRNKVKGTDMAIDTIEIYSFGDDGSVAVRYFVKELA